MNSLTELNFTELVEINGGESFAYRVGQAISLLTFKNTGVPSYGAVKAQMDWFG